jgi:hypothetical protein
MMFFGKAKYSEKDMVFSVIPHDSVGRRLRGADVVFLERGNPNAGLAHIMLRHFADFQTRGFDVDGVVALLRHTIANLRPLNAIEEARGLGLEYAFDDRLYPELRHDTLKVAMGYNGFIVSAFVCGLSTEMGRLRGIAENAPKQDIADQ